MVLNSGPHPPTGHVWICWCRRPISPAYLLLNRFPHLLLEIHRDGDIAFYPGLKFIWNIKQKSLFWSLRCLKFLKVIGLAPVCIYIYMCGMHVRYVLHNIMWQKKHFWFSFSCFVNNPTNGQGWVWNCLKSISAKNLIQWLHSLLSRPATEKECSNSLPGFRVSSLT